jgi:hypothetical protein
MYDTTSDLNKQAELLKCLKGFDSSKMSGLVKKLIKGDVVSTEKVCKTLLQVDRGEFTDDKKFAYMDS